MFAIYNIDGRRFRDTLENLRKIEALHASNGLHLQTDETKKNVLSNLESKNRRNDIVSGKSLQSYRKTLNINQHEPILHVYQLMSNPVTTVQMNTDILEASRYFQKKSFQQMPVINQQQRIVGLLTVTDLFEFFMPYAEKLSSARKKRVSDVMTAEVITADPVTDIRRVARVMHDYHLFGVPIVNDKDMLIGIVSRSDIIHAVANDPPLNLWS